MIPVKKLLKFTEEEKILYERYIRKSQKNNITFIKVPVFLVFENFKLNITSLKLIYSDGKSIQKDVFDVYENKFDVIEYKEDGLSYAVIYKKKTAGIIFENEVKKLFKLSFNPYSQWKCFR